MVKGKFIENAGLAERLFFIRWNQTDNAPGDSASASIVPAVQVDGNTLVDVITMAIEPSVV